MMIKRLMLVAGFVLGMGLMPIAAQAQQQPVFSSYDEMRSILDELMMSRQVGRVMERFGGADEMGPEERANLETRMRELFPLDFRHKSVVRVDPMESGWSQEMYAYWTGLSYVWVSVLLHQKENELVVINIKFNTDFFELIGSF